MYVNNNVGDEYNMKHYQATNYLLNLYSKPVKRIHLIRLLYLANRESLIETTCPIIDDIIVYGKEGLIFPDVYECFNFDICKDPFLKGYDYIKPSKKCKTDELSLYELKLIKKIKFKYSFINNRSTYNLFLDIQKLPEWKYYEKYYIIDVVEDILKVEKNVSKKQIQEYIIHEKSAQFFKSLGI